MEGGGKGPDSTSVVAGRVREGAYDDRAVRALTPHCAQPPVNRSSPSSSTTLLLYSTTVPQSAGPRWRRLRAAPGPPPSGLGSRRISTPSTAPIREGARESDGEVGLRQRRASKSYVILKVNSRPLFQQEPDDVDTALECRHHQARPPLPMCERMAGGKEGWR